MKKLKHTPGPWVLKLSNRASKTISGDSHYIYKNGSDPMSEMAIASVRAHDHKTRKGNIGTCEADARLIAAAPELLEAAKYALKCLDAANEALGGWASKEYYVECREELKAAIAKAEGKK